MTSPVDWGSLVGGGAITLLVWWASHGTWNVVQTIRARRQKIAADEREAAAQEETDERTRRRRAERLVRVYDDYVTTLRWQVMGLGGVPARWPRELTREE